MTRDTLGNAMIVVISFLYFFYFISLFTLRSLNSQMNVSIAIGFSKAENRHGIVYLDFLLQQIQQRAIVLIQKVLRI